MTTPDSLAGEPLREAALALIAAEEAVRDALNGLGHPGEDHDRWLAPHGHDMGGGVVMRDEVGDCSACGGAQYGTDDDKTRAYARLRQVLGLPLRPWEEAYVEPRALAGEGGTDGR